MIELALEAKGVPRQSMNHYTATSNNGLRTSPDALPESGPPPAGNNASNQQLGEDNGIDL